MVVYPSVCCKTSGNGGVAQWESGCLTRNWSGVQIPPPSTRVSRQCVFALDGALFFMGGGYAPIMFSAGWAEAGKPPHGNRESSITHQRSGSSKTHDADTIPAAQNRPGSDRDWTGDESSSMARLPTPTDTYRHLPTSTDTCRRLL